MTKQSFIAIVIVASCSCMTGTSSRNDKFKNISKTALIDSMIKSDTYEGEFEGLTGDTTEQWLYYKQFMKRYSEEELIVLSNNKNPILRCLAFQALADNCSQSTFQILLMHLSDTTEFTRFYRCMGGTDRVSDNFLDAVGYDKKTPTKFTLSEDQYNYVDSILLFGEEIKEKSSLSSIEYRSRRYVLERQRPLPQFHRRLRELVNAGVYEALLVLAKYKDPADTPIFISLLLDDEFSNRGRNKNIYLRKAIRYFPHPSFYPILKKQLLDEIGTNAIWDTGESYPLYFALAQYPTKETRKLFEQAIKESPEGEVGERSKFIYNAIQSNLSSVFDGLVAKPAYNYE